MQYPARKSGVLLFNVVYTKVSTVVCDCFIESQRRPQYANREEIMAKDKKDKKSKEEPGGMKAAKKAMEAASKVKRASRKERRAIQLRDDR